MFYGLKVIQNIYVCILTTYNCNGVECRENAFRNFLSCNNIYCFSCRLAFRCKNELITYAATEKWIYSFQSIAKTCVKYNVPKIIMYVNSLLSALPFFLGLVSFINVLVHLTQGDVPHKQRRITCSDKMTFKHV